MDNIRETGELVFTTTLDWTRIIRIPNPAPGITQTVVNTAAIRLIAANPFDETVGGLVALKRSDRVIVSRKVLLPVA